MTRKTPIDAIGKDKRKVTIADELSITTFYNVNPPLPTKELWFSWLEPSEVEVAKESRCRLIVDGHAGSTITNTVAEILPMYIKEEALRNKNVIIQQYVSELWSRVKRKVLRKFNLTNLYFNSLSQMVVQLGIESKQPLYDQDAHSNRVRNVLRAVKVRHPHTTFIHEECLTSGSCPIGLQESLRKLAMETHGK